MKWNKCGEMISIDLNNNYTVHSLIKWDTDDCVYYIKLYLSNNDDFTGMLYYMEDFDISLDGNKKIIYNIVAQYIQDLFEDNRFKSYISRYEYEQHCMSIGIEFMEKV